MAVEGPAVVVVGAGVVVGAAVVVVGAGVVVLLEEGPTVVKSVIVKTLSSGE
jgi:hypothetical protein